MSTKNVWLSPPGAAKHLPKTSAASVRQWAEEGLIRGAYRTPSGRWQIPLDGLLEAYVESTPSAARPFMADLRLLLGMADDGGRLDLVGEG